MRNQGCSQGAPEKPLTLPVSEAVVVQFLVDHTQRKNKTGLVSELPPAIDQALVAAGLKAELGPLKLATLVQRVAVLSTSHKLKRLTNPCELASVRTSQPRPTRCDQTRQAPDQEDRHHAPRARGRAGDLRRLPRRPA